MQSCSLFLTLLQSPTIIVIDVNREGKESYMYIGDFKCVLGNYVDN